MSFPGDQLTSTPPWPSQADRKWRIVQNEDMLFSSPNTMAGHATKPPVVSFWSRNFPPHHEPAAPRLSRSTGDLVDIEDHTHKCNVIARGFLCRCACSCGVFIIAGSGERCKLKSLLSQMPWKCLSLHLIRSSLLQDQAPTPPTPPTKKNEMQRPSS